MKACRRNPISFSRFLNAFIRKKKNSHTALSEKRKTEKSWNLFYLRGHFMKPLKMAINHFFFNRSFCSQDLFLFCKLVHSAIFVFLMSGLRKKYQKGKLRTANS